jgi:hypothetical protein
MLPSFLLTENTAYADGHGPEIELGPDAGKPLIITLGIERILEQESLEVAIWGAPDKAHWSARPLASFPPKFYCGVYSISLNLAIKPDIRYLRVGWKMNRWGRDKAAPLFGFYVCAEEAGAGAATAGLHGLIRNVAPTSDPREWPATPEPSRPWRQPLTAASRPH